MRDFIGVFALFICAVGLVLGTASIIFHVACAPPIEWDQPRRVYWAWGSCVEIIGQYRDEESTRDALAQYLKNPSRTLPR